MFLNRLGRQAGPASSGPAVDAYKLKDLPSNSIGRLSNDAPLPKLVVSLSGFLLLSDACTYCHVFTGYKNCSWTGEPTR